MSNKTAAAMAMVEEARRRLNRHLNYSRGVGVQPGTGLYPIEGDANRLASFATAGLMLVAARSGRRLLNDDLPWWWEDASTYATGWCIGCRHMASVDRIRNWPHATDCPALVFDTLLGCIPDKEPTP